MKPFSLRRWRHRLQEPRFVAPIGNARTQVRKPVGRRWRRQARRGGEVLLVIVFLGIMVLTIGDQTRVGRDFRRILRLPEGSSGTRAQGCGVPETQIGTVTTDHVDARRHPSPTAAVVASFGRTNPQGAPQVFDLVDAALGTDGSVWFKASLPVRPNGTVGFIPVNAVQVGQTGYRLKLDREHFSLSLWHGCKLRRRFRVGIGVGDTPTPVGKFYLSSLLKPPTPNGVYGDYAYGLSAFSDKLVNWPAGGIVGLHGTNDPSSIGRRSSHGCIRMNNKDIDYLVKLLPLGTPIAIS